MEESGPGAGALGRQFLKLGGGNYPHGNHNLGGNPLGRNSGHWRLEYHSESSNHSVGSILVVITVGGTLVVTVREGDCVTVVGAWWGALSVQSGQTQPPLENMDFIAGPGSPEQVEWIYLLQRLHCIDVTPNLTEQAEHENLDFIGRTGSGPRLG